MRPTIRTLVATLTAAVVALSPVVVPAASAGWVTASSGSSGVATPQPQGHQISRDGLTLSWTNPDEAAHMERQDRAYAGSVMQMSYEGQNVKKVTYRWVGYPLEDVSNEDTYTINASDIWWDRILAHVNVEFDDGSTNFVNFKIDLAEIDEPIATLAWERAPVPGGPAVVRAVLNPRLAEIGWDGKAYTSLAIDGKGLAEGYSGHWASRTFTIPGNASGKAYTLEAGEITQDTFGAVPGFRFVDATLTGVVKGANRYGVPVLSTPNSVFLALGKWPGTVTAWVVNWYVDGTLVQSSRIENNDYVDLLGQTPAYAGHRIQAKVSAVYIDGTSSPEVSTATVVMPLINDGWVHAAITGQTKVGTTLKAKLEADGRLNKRSIQWTRDGKDISGARKVSYKIIAGDLGHKVGVRFSAAATGYQTKTATASTPKVALTKLVPGGVVLRGTSRPGKTMAAVPTKWPSGVKYTYQWYRSGKAIKGATKSSYRLSKLDAKKRVHVVVTGTKPWHTKAMARSAQWTVQAR